MESAGRAGRSRRQRRRIAVNSRGRAGHVRTLTHFNAEVNLFVERRERDAYAAAHPECRVHTVPDDCGLTRARNVVLDWAAAEGLRNVYIFDDDIIGFCRRVDKGRRRPVDGEAVLDELDAILDKGYAQASVSYLPSNWKVAQLFKVDTRVWCMTAFSVPLLRERGVRYDEACPLMQDYDITAQLLAAGEHNCVSYRLMFDCVPHGQGEGGCQLYRTPELAKAASLYLLTKWGDRCVRLADLGHGRLEVQFAWKRVRELSAMSQSHGCRS